MMYDKYNPMQKYSLTVLVNEKVSEADRNGIFDAIKKNFGSLIKEDLWGVRSLAYDIKHANRAFYGYFEFEAEPTAIIALDKNIRLNEDIIRYLIVKIEVKRQKSKGKSTSQNSKTEEKVDEVAKEPVPISKQGGEIEAKEAEIEVKTKKVKTKN